MGLFDRKSGDEASIDKRLDGFISEVENLYLNKPEKKFLIYLENAKKNREKLIIKPFELWADTIEIILANKTNFNTDNYMSVIGKAEDIYSKIFVYEESTPNFDALRIVFLELFDKNGIISKNLFNVILFDTFKNKSNYIDMMKVVMGDAKIYEALYDVIQYATRVRAFFVDDDMYAANLKYVATKLLIAGDRKEVVEEEAIKIERMAGIYNVDEAAVAKTEEQLVQANALLKQSIEVLEQVDRKTEQISRIMEDTSNTIIDISKRETDMIAVKAKTARDDINAAYNGFLEEQRQEVILQKDVLLSQIFKESEDKLNELRCMSRALTATATSELTRLNAETSNAIDKISNYMSNDEALTKALSKAEENEDLLNRLRKIEILNDKNIEAISQGIENVKEENANPVNRVYGATKPAVTYTYDNSVNVTERNPGVIPEVNPLLDTSVPFETRFKIVMAEKQRRIEAGEHFHEKFDDVVIALMEDSNPYMIGPSGCGKTYMVKQIASILNMDSIDIGYINEEYDILGFQTATGEYSTPNFYRCYKYGIIAFCDELDNGNSRATVKLNSFLSNNDDASYSFPNGENVKRHKNFRIIAAGNTAGNGADANYNTREKIEESVQQRLTPIYVDYDNCVEEKILEDYRDWYEFIVLFRSATDAWGNMNDCAAAGIVTTRDTSRIKRYLVNKSFDMSKILDYEFVQTKDEEYLAFIVKHISERIDGHPGAREIFTMFEEKVRLLRERGGKR